MPQDVVIGRVGTVRTAFLGRRPSACPVSFLGPDGVELFSGAGTVDPVNTTLAVAAAQYDRSVTLANPAGVAVWPRRYLLGDEEVTVRSVSGSVATLWAPLKRAHASGAPFQGLLVTFDVDATATAAEVWDCLAVFTPDAGDPQVEVVNLVRYKIPDHLISEVDTRSVVPKDMGAEDSELDVFQKLADARDRTVLEVGTRSRAMGFVGTEVFREIAKRSYWLLQRTNFGPQWADVMDRLEQEKKDLVILAREGSPRSKPDGAVAAPTSTEAPGDLSFEKL